LEPIPDVLAVFEAGSASFGRVDDFSDIDLVADVQPGAEDVVFELLEAGLAACVKSELPHCAEPFLARKIIPVPAWHGMHQRFYRLAATNEWLLLDIALRPANQPELFAEAERHGSPCVIFDKRGRIKAAPLDLAAQRTSITQRLAELRENLILFGNFAEKECRRGRAIDAVAVYHGMLPRPLVELLRIRHDPARHDFGLRYLDFDLPTEVHARLAALAYPAGLDELLSCQAEAREWMAELLDELAPHT
jgi:hypothetical protein